MGADVSVVDWVEQGKAPDSVTAKARDAGPNVVTTELPASWSANRTRPLCVYPKVARYNGSGMWRARAVLAASEGRLEMRSPACAGLLVCWAGH